MDIYHNECLVLKWILLKYSWNKHSPCFAKWTDITVTILEELWGHLTCAFTIGLWFPFISHTDYTIVSCFVRLFTFAVIDPKLLCYVANYIVNYITLRHDGTLQTHACSYIWETQQSKSVKVTFLDWLSRQSFNPLDFCLLKLSFCLLK